MKVIKVYIRKLNLVESYQLYHQMFNFFYYLFLILILEIKNFFDFF